MEKTILLLEKRGCDFRENDEIKKISDLENYRFFAISWAPKNATKGNYILEISKSCRYEKRKDTYKKVHEHALNISAAFCNEFGEWRNLSLESLLCDFIQEKDLKYTSNDLIEVLNAFGKYKVQKIVIADNCYNDLEKIGGFRETVILQNCIRTTEIMQNAKHHIVRFYDKHKDFFDYDLITKKIVG